MTKLISGNELRYDRYTMRFYPGGIAEEERPAGAPDIDGAFSMATLKRGQPFILIGTLQDPVDMMPMDAASDIPDYNVNNLVIKTPGSDEHTLPFELGLLENFMMACATHQYMYSADARDKIGFLTFRTGILDANTAQIGQDSWHTHKNPTPGVLSYRMRALDIPLRSVMQSAHITPDSISSIYIASDIACTLVQASPAAEDMEITETPYSYTVDKAAFAVAKLAPYQIAHGNSYSFHRADKPAPDEIGQRRHFMQMTYAPVA